MSILLFLLVLLVLVLVHEFGHFMVAKMAGIRVDEFAFGFPPRLFTVKKGETNYSFNALPLGGYVKIYGENPDDVTPGPDASRSFTAKPRVIQGAVIVAGIVGNILLAWLLISATLMIGIPSSIDDGSGYTLRDQRIMITGTKESSPASVAGLLSGDVIVGLADADSSLTPASPSAVSDFIHERGGKEISLRVLRNNEERVLPMIPISGITAEGSAVGIYMEAVGTLKLPIHLAVIEGAKRTYVYTHLTAVGLYDFLSKALIGRGDFSSVTGPVGIVNAVGDAAGLGFSHLLLFSALISINLAIINIIPFPALDGGRLLFIVIEGIMRRPIKPVVANALNIGGFALLMLLMLLVTWHDIAKLL